VAEHCKECGRKLNFFTKARKDLCLHCFNEENLARIAEENEGSCKFCGAPLPKESNFCLKCGKQLDSTDNLPLVETIKDISISEDPQALIRYVNDKSSTKRIQSINALGDMRCVEACECLGHALKDKDQNVRLSALRALSIIGNPAPEIFHGLLDGSADVRALAAEILGRTGNEEAIIPLVSTSRDKNNVVRLSAVRALGNLSVSETPRDPSVQTWPPNARRLKALVRSLRDPDRDVQQAAKEALIKIGPEASDAMKDVCDDPDIRVKKLAAEILSKIENEQQTEDASGSVRKTRVQREELAPTLPTNERPVAGHVVEQSGAGQFDRLPRQCEYCNKFFKPNRENQRFCSASCSSKGSAIGSKREELAPTLPTNELPVAGHVVEQSGAGQVVPSAQRVEPSDIPDWSYETFLFKRVAEYDGPHKEIVASAVPFFNLLCELLNDILIDWHTKVKISSALGYLVLADDVIPDRSENGLIDDIFVMSYILHGINERFSSEPIKRNWHLDEDVCTMIDATYDACNDLIQSQKLEILQKVGLHKFESLDLEEYSGTYQKRLGKVGREKRELLGLLAYVVKKMGGAKVDRSSVENIRRHIEKSGDAAEINRIVELANQDHQIEVLDKEMEAFKDGFYRIIAYFDLLKPKRVYIAQPPHELVCPADDA
jgi:HEAT repeat protein/uncharacterized membrane protein YkvA (DUF1232 family)